MKSRLYILTILAGAIGTTSSFGDLSATVQLTDSFGTTGGGEFLAQAQGMGFTPASRGFTDSGQFEVFCIERNEFIKLGATYFVEVTGAAVSGGAGGPNPDPLDPRTAYLYTKFITRQLDGYDNGTGSERVQSANALQHVIWYIEEELSLKEMYVGLNTAESNLAKQFLSDADGSGWTDTGNVRVMNIYAQAVRTGDLQDQIVMVPTPGATTLGLVGLIAIIRLRRRLA